MLALVISRCLSSKIKSTYQKKKKKHNRFKLFSMHPTFRKSGSPFLKSLCAI